MEVVVHPTSNILPPEDLENVVHIKAVEDSTQNCPLPYTIAETEDARNDSIPSNICVLEGINNYEDSEEDQGQPFLEELLEEQGMLNQIKSFGHVSLTSEDF
jgi:hypothetical protein